MRVALLFPIGLTVTACLGCGSGSKIEMPKDTIEAPKNVMGVGAGSGKGGGLPAPPNEPPPK